MTWLTPEIIIGAVLAAIAIFAAVPYVAKKIADIRFVEVQIRKVEAESAALNDAEQTRINAQTFSDLRESVVVLRGEIVTLRGEVLTLNNAYQQERIDSHTFKLNWEEALRLITERNQEIADLKDTIEKLREQLTKYIEKTMRSQDTVTSPADTKLLKDTKQDQVEAAVEKAADETNDK